MQTQPSSSGLEQLFIEVAKFLGTGGLVGFLTWLTMRKKVKPEIQLTEATAAKTYAEARHIDGETLNDAYKRIEELYVIADGQRTQISRLQMECDKRGMELEFQETELKWLKGVMHAAGVNLSDYDYLRRKATPEVNVDKPKG
jgi:hypothetical protein